MSGANHNFGPGEEPGKKSMPIRDYQFFVLKAYCGDHKGAMRLLSGITGESLHILKATLLRAAGYIADELERRHPEPGSAIEKEKTHE